MIPLTDVLGRHVDARWLPVGIALQLASQALRSRGRFNILRASYPDAHDLRARDVMAASFAGAGINGIVPARGGDLVKFALVHPRIADARYVTLATTSLPETAFDSLCSAALIAGLFLGGLLPMPSTAHAPEAVVLVLIVLAAGIAVLRQVSRRRRHVVDDARRGLAICSCRRRFVAQVASWQALARLARLGSLVCFLAAFALPATLATALLVMAAQGGGRIVPIAPIGTGMRVAMLSYGLAGVSGQAATPAALASFTLGTSALLLVVMLAIASVLVARELGTCSPWRAVRCARERFGDGAVRHAVERRPDVAAGDLDVSASGATHDCHLTTPSPRVDARQRDAVRKRRAMVHAERTGARVAETAVAGAAVGGVPMNGAHRGDGYGQKSALATERRQRGEIRVDPVVDRRSQAPETHHLWRARVRRLRRAPVRS